MTLSTVTVIPGFSDTVGQGINIELGQQSEMDWYKTWRATGFGVAGGLVLPRFSGLNAGRNSSEAVFNTQYSRLSNGYISRISPMVSFRGGLGNQATPVTQGVAATSGEIIYKRAVGQ